MCELKRQAEARLLLGPLPMLSEVDKRLMEFCGLKRFVSLCLTVKLGVVGLSKASARCEGLSVKRQELSLPLFS